MVSTQGYSNNASYGTYSVEYSGRTPISIESLKSLSNATRLPLSIEQVPHAPWTEKRKAKPRKTRERWPPLLRAISNRHDRNLQVEIEVENVQQQALQEVHWCEDGDDDCLYCIKPMDIDQDVPSNSPSPTPSEVGQENRILRPAESNGSVTPQPIQLDPSHKGSLPPPRSRRPAFQSLPPLSALSLNEPWTPNLSIPLSWPPINFASPSPVLRVDQAMAGMRNDEFPFAYSPANLENEGLGHVSDSSTSNSTELTSDLRDGVIVKHLGNFRPRSSRGNWEPPVQEILQENSQPFSKAIQRPTRQIQAEVPDSPRLPALGDDFDDDDEDYDEVEDIGDNIDRMEVDAPVYLYELDQLRRSLEATAPPPPQQPISYLVPTQWNWNTNITGIPTRFRPPPPLSQSLTRESKWKMQIVRHQRSLVTRGIRHPGFPPSPLNPNWKRNQQSKA